MNTSANFTWNFNFVICAYIYTAFTSLDILMLPLFMFVLYTGFKQRRNQRSSAPSHSDVFIYNMAVMEVIGVVGSCLICFSAYTWRFDTSYVGHNLHSVTEYGQIWFHNLTCLERYLAVVHPVTYLRLKNKTGVVLRNITVVGVWLISFGVTCLYAFQNELLNLLSFLITVILSLAFITFFSAKVLCVLIRPGPGEGGRDKTHVDQSKRRAFTTMAAILVALLLKFVIILVAYIVILFSELNSFTEFLLSVATQFLNIPSSLVLPVLYLYRAGNLDKMVKIRHRRHNK